MCRVIYKDEWSGVLFYTVDGTITDPQNMKITLQDIYLMDKGSSAYTEYSFNEDVVAYRMSLSREALYWKMGHIHSHNTMNVYFSGTDISELNDNSKFYNYYLSIIVNNFNEIVGKVAFRGVLTNPTFHAKDEQGKPYPLNIKMEEEPTLFHYDCEIKHEMEELAVPESFAERTAHIIKKQYIVDSQKKKTKPTNTSTGVYQNGVWIPATKTTQVSNEYIPFNDENEGLFLEMDSFLIYWLSSGEPLPISTLLSEVANDVDAEIEAETDQSRGTTVDFYISTFSNMYDDYFGSEVRERDYSDDIKVAYQLLKDTVSDYKSLKPLLGFLEEEIKMSEFNPLDNVEPLPKLTEQEN